MPFIKVKITKLISKDFPGFIECSFFDANSKKWKIIEKIPVVSKQNIDENSDFPLEGSIAIEIEKEWINEKGKKLATINTEKPWGLESTEGETHFNIYFDQIIFSNGI